MRGAQVQSRTRRDCPLIVHYIFERNLLSRIEGFGRIVQVVQ